MTGSIPQFTRQHSSTTGNSTTEKSFRSKLRRCSSVDDHSPLELMPIVNQQKEIFVFKRDPHTSDVDSGTEESEQQSEQVFISTSNDNEDQLSIKSFGPNPDEGFSDYEREEERQLAKIQRDLELAKMIINETKKDFCMDTRVAFHGEFARNISVPLSLTYTNIRYYLFAHEELNEEFLGSIPIAYNRVDNAKAQFKCPNSRCEHAWTSMRARILFSFTVPEIGYVILKILGQNCQRCGTNADALWYIDEVCRVMKNFAQSLFEIYFPDMLDKVGLDFSQPLEQNVRSFRHPNHDPTQRKGKMYAPHRREFCEACRLGLCFA